MPRKLVLEEDKGVHVEKTKGDCGMCEEDTDIIEEQEISNVAICLSCAEQVVSLLKPKAATRRRAPVVKK